MTTALHFQMQLFSKNVFILTSVMFVSIGTLPHMASLMSTDGTVISMMHIVIQCTSTEQLSLLYPIHSVEN